MSTKLLVWNLQGFTINKMSPQADDWVSLGTGAKRVKYQYSAQKVKYILSNVGKYKPDIFAVIEVISGQGPRGSLINTNGELGCIELLKQLKVKDKNWYLIPPLRLVNKVQVDEKDGYAQLVSEKSYTEGIAIFFRGDKLDFVGPYIWPLTDPKNINPDTVAQPIGPAGPYPGDWQKGLPPNNYFAGQYKFLGKDLKEIQFPSISSRCPFLVQFREQKKQKRLITLITLHFPPNNTSTEAFAKLTSYIKEYKMAKDEIMLVAGDFNIKKSYLYGQGFVKDAGLVAMFTDKTSIGTTMNMSAKEATPTLYLKPGELLDNVLFRPGSKELIPLITLDAQIADRVDEDSLLTTPMKEIMDIDDEDEQDEVFRHPLNFGYLGPSPGTSDHLALYAEI
ncbi:endonuclease/exonuclease/phosphatase family protein [Chitinophaga sp. RAB17]|uniref:endonuclease/exonuclease/phosphatase family protein n=1 Tax=Chitinophaga sp. RAB17 TaxID=3233049 RepID=UPI003F92BA0A